MDINYESIKKDFSVLVNKKPYEISNRGFLKTQITLNGENLCTVPSNLADDILNLLNGSYIEGVTTSYSTILSKF